MDIQNKFHGHNIIADDTFVVPASSQGWIANNTDVAITLNFGAGGSVYLAVGQTHCWNNGGSPEWQYITVIVSGMNSGFVGCCWGL